MQRSYIMPHFLVRGFEKVRDEMALLVHCYNLRRLLSILGIEGFIAACRKRRQATLHGDAFLLLFFLRLRRPRRLFAPFHSACPCRARHPRLALQRSPSPPKARWRDGSIGRENKFAISALYPSSHSSWMSQSPDKGMTDQPRATPWGSVVSSSPEGA